MKNESVRLRGVCLQGLLRAQADIHSSIDGQAAEALKLSAPAALVRGDLVIPVYDLNKAAPCGPWAAQWDEASRTLTIPADWTGFGAGE